VALVAPLVIWFFPKRTVIFVFYTFIFTPAVCFNILFHAGATAAFGVYCPGLITHQRCMVSPGRSQKLAMITLNIFYPFKEGSRFDMDYYLNTHIPMSIQRLGNALKGVVIEAGVAGTEPGAPPAFAALCYMRFESIEAFVEVFTLHSAALQGDIKNYTDVEPIIQFSEEKFRA
jgi:uncharacterized protein (TIGR02118 family)